MSHTHKRRSRKPATRSPKHRGTTEPEEKAKWLDDANLPALMIGKVAVEALTKEKIDIRSYFVDPGKREFSAFQNTRSSFAYDVCSFMLKHFTELKTKNDAFYAVKAVTAGYIPSFLIQHFNVVKNLHFCKVVKTLYDTQTQCKGNTEQSNTVLEEDEGMNFGALVMSLYLSMYSTPALGIKISQSAERSNIVNQGLPNLLNKGFDTVTKFFKMDSSIFNTIQKGLQNIDLNTVTYLDEVWESLFKRFIAEKASEYPPYQVQYWDYWNKFRYDEKLPGSLCSKTMLGQALHDEEVDDE